MLLFHSEVTQDKTPTVRLDWRTMATDTIRSCQGQA